MFERDKLQNIATRFKSNDNWTKYKRVRNQVNESIRLAKASYYNTYFKNNRVNIKNTWKGVYLIMGKNSQSTRINRLKIWDIDYTSPNEISIELNNHFSQVGPTLANEIPVTTSKFSDYLNPTQHTFTLIETSSDNIFKLIQSMSSNKASGLDGISCRLLKEAAPIVSPSLAYITNLSITTGIFPDDWKIARVLPIYKEDNKTNPNNYRPISILPIVSKLIERIVFSQFYAYLMQHNLLTDIQSGFRPLQSTLTALLDASNDW